MTDYVLPCTETHHPAVGIHYHVLNTPASDVVLHNLRPMMRHGWVDLRGRYSKDDALVTQQHHPCAEYAHPAAPHWHSTRKEGITTQVLWGLEHPNPERFDIDQAGTYAKGSHLGERPDPAAPSSGQEKFARGTGDLRRAAESLVGKRIKCTIPSLAYQSRDPWFEAGCQRFTLTELLNADGGVRRVDDQHVEVTFHGTVDAGPVLRIGTGSGVRGVSLNEIGEGCDTEVVETPAPADVVMNLQPGVYTCRTHTRHYFLMNAARQHTDPGIVAMLNRDTNALVSKSARDAGFTDFPDCRPALTDTWIDLFGASNARPRTLPTKVTAEQREAGLR